MNIGEIIHGFRLKEKQTLPETGGDGLYFEHEQSGARLLVLANDDPNKTFGIGFRTPSHNSTGVAHILEHSVLNGSEKYRTKEPFMDLAKSSLATFLNAMTFSDKTIYPVASRNDQDFRHLMDVYLDAVFHPSIYRTKEIFLQEGWHYHLEDKADPITYRGVVYNEMRGALSGADEQVDAAILEALYPDTVYGCESGGDPYEIPNLTYEAFCDFHRNYYHPVNSYLYLYGKVDLDEVLAYIDRDYLSSFNRIELDSSLQRQEPFTEPKYIESDYSVAGDDDIEGKDYLAYSVVFGTRDNLRDIFLSDLLTDALISSQAGPLRKALLAAGIGADVSSFSSDGLQIPFGIVAKDTDGSRRDEFVNIIETCLRDLAENGIDQDLLLASLNKLEFSYREASGYATRGIVYYINAFESWLYDQSPFAALAYNAPLAALREDIKSNRLGKELLTRIVNNPHKVIMTAKPNPGKNERRDEAVATELTVLKNSLDDEQLDALIAETQRLIDRQNRQDTPEERATLPTLSLVDIDAKVERVPRETHELEGATVLLHDLFTSGVIYLDMLFKTEHIHPEELCDYSLLTTLIGSVDTKKRSYSDVATEEYLLTGGISISPTIYTHHEDRTIIYPRLSLATRVLSSSDNDQIFALLKEMLLESDFSDSQRIHEVVQMLRSRMEMGVFQQGHAVASARALSYINKQGKYGESLAGLDFLFYLQDLDKHFDERKDALMARLNNLYQRLLNKEDILISITGERQDCLRMFPAMGAFLASLPTDIREACDYLPATEILNEGILSAAGVQYVAQAADLTKFGLEYNGRLEVLSNLLSHEFLYNEIRAKGGAYGQGIRFSQAGYMTVYSYRDPNLAETFDVYRSISNWLKNLDFDAERLNPFIIGTMNRFDPALTEQNKGRLDMRLALTGQSFEDIERIQQEALAVTVEELRSYADAIAKGIDENIRCVLGSAAKIKQEETRFDRLVRLDNGA